MFRNRSSTKRMSRSGGWIVAWVVTVAILMLAAPLTEARTYRAPYAHYLATGYGVVRQVSGCANEKSSKPTFNGHNGIGFWSGHASAKTCAGGLQSNVTSSVGASGGGAEVAIGIHMPAGLARITTIAVTWNFSASGTANLTINRPCPIPVLVNGTGTSICVAQAVAMIVGDAWLVDLTNGSVVYAYNSPISIGQYNTSENTTICNPNCTSGTYSYAGGAAFSGAQSATFTISATTDSAHKYAIVTYLGGTISTEMQGYGGRATGSINMGTGGNEYQLVSVAIK
jgi:hypothetical protein